MRHAITPLIGPDPIYPDPIYPRDGDPRARLVRTPDRPLSRSPAGYATARLLRLCVGLFPRLAPVPARNDGTHGGDRRVRGAVVQHARPHRRLAFPGPTPPA